MFFFETVSAAIFFFSVEVINKFYLPINVDIDQFVVSLVNFLSTVRLQTLRGRFRLNLQIALQTVSKRTKDGILVCPKDSSAFQAERTPAIVQKQFLSNFIVWKHLRTSAAYTHGQIVNIQ